MLTDISSLANPGTESNMPFKCHDLATPSLLKTVQDSEWIYHEDYKQIKKVGGGCHFGQT